MPKLCVSLKTQLYAQYVNRLWISGLSSVEEICEWSVGRYDEMGYKSAYHYNYRNPELLRRQSFGNFHSRDKMLYVICIMLVGEQREFNLF